MSKLTTVVSYAFTLFSIWYAMVFGIVKHRVIDQYMEFIKYSPIIFVFLFGIYAATVVLYRVFTFNNCEEAARSLQKEIRLAKEDLTKRGMKF